MIFAFLDKHVVTTSCNFWICKHILFDQIFTPFLLSYYYIYKTKH